MEVIDTIVERVLERIMPVVVRALNENDRSARHGKILAETYDQTDHTVAVLQCDTYDASADDGDQAIIHYKVPLANLPGVQDVPIGDEHVALLRTQTGWIAVPHNDPVEGPVASARARAVPAGEHWRGHRNPTTGAYDVEQRFTNDGAQVGDGKGGYSVGGGSLAKTYTVGGITVTLDDHANTAVIGNGTLEILVDFGAGKVNIGAASLDGTNDAIVTHTYDQQNINAVLASVQTAITALAARCASGSGVVAPSVGAVTGVASGTVRAKA